MIQTADYNQKFSDLTVCGSEKSTYVYTNTVTWQEKSVRQLLYLNTTRFTTNSLMKHNRYNLYTIQQSFLKILWNIGQIIKKEYVACLSGNIRRTLPKCSPQRCNIPKLWMKVFRALSGVSVGHGLLGSMERLLKQTAFIKRGFKQIYFTQNIDQYSYKTLIRCQLVNQLFSNVGLTFPYCIEVPLV